MIKAFLLAAALGAFACLATADPHDFNTQCSLSSGSANCGMPDIGGGMRNLYAPVISVSYYNTAQNANVAVPFTSPASSGGSTYQALSYRTDALDIGTTQLWTINLAAIYDGNNGDTPLNTLSDYRVVTDPGDNCATDSAFFCTADDGLAADTLSPSSFDQFIELDVHVAANPHGGTPAGVWHFGFGLTEGDLGSRTASVNATAGGDGSTYFTVSGTVGEYNGVGTIPEIQFVFLDSAFTADPTDSVPEPATLLLMGSGLLALARRFRR